MIAYGLPQTNHEGQYSFSVEEGDIAKGTYRQDISLTIWGQPTKVVANGYDVAGNTVKLTCNFQ